MTKKQKAIVVMNELEQIYPDAFCSLTYNFDYELLIAVRLSAQCTDERVNKITPLLFSKYNTLEKLSTADISDVQNIVKPCGLGKTKGKDIVMLSKMLIEKFNSTVPDNMDDLLLLPGIGRKTANVILGDIYKKPAVVCDTHCIRITNKLGLSDVTDPFKVEMQLLKILDPLRSSDLCHRFVFFGRDTCTARSPKCSNCKLSYLCKYFKCNFK
ncbi:MAG: endonuclease III [Oscillospiraceae bacterium]